MDAAGDLAPVAKDALIETTHVLKPFFWAIIAAYNFHLFLSLIHRNTRLPTHLITTWLYLMVGLVLVLPAINLGPNAVDQCKEFQDETP